MLAAAMLLQFWNAVNVKMSSAQKGPNIPPGDRSTGETGNQM